MISRLRGSIERVLPDGCPFVIGGGLIRDALYGGRPNDIDIWLPSNIHVPDVDAFCAHLVRSGYGPQQGFQGQVIFRGPGSRVEEVVEDIFGGFGDAEHDNAGYGDVHNHWVIEITPAESPAGHFVVNAANHPRVNIMRNMARWTGDAPSWFTEIMRNFDLDICMYFVGYMPGQTNVNTVIMPEHVYRSLRASNRTRRLAPVRMNEVYWNQARLETTSVERIRSRVEKMNEKYMLRLPLDIERIQMIPTAEIVAQPVALRDLIFYFNGHHGFGCTHTPERANRMQLADYNHAMEEAQREWSAWHQRQVATGAQPSLAITPAAFMRYSQ